MQDGTVGSRHRGARLLSHNRQPPEFNLADDLIMINTSNSRVLPSSPSTAAAAVGAGWLCGGLALAPIGA